MFSILCNSHGATSSMSLTFKMILWSYTMNCPHFLDMETEACWCPVACWRLVTKHWNYSPICLEQVFGTKATVQVFFTYIMTGFGPCLNTKTRHRVNLSKQKGIYTWKSLWIKVTKSEPDLTLCVSFLISKLLLVQEPDVCSWKNNSQDDCLAISQYGCLAILQDN